MAKIKESNPIFCLAFLILLGFSCVGCSNTEEATPLNGYSIVEGEVIKQQKLYQTSQFVTVKAFQTVEFRTVGWTFPIGSIFFAGDCQITYSQLVLFSNELSLITPLGSERYRCTGTNFSSNSIREETFKGILSYQAKENDGDLALFLEADLKMYTFTRKKDNKFFELYVSVSDCLLTLEKAQL